MTRAPISFRALAGGPLTVGIVYFVTATAAVSLTRFGGGVACLWVATGVLIAGLEAVEPRLWIARIGACWLATVAATGFFGIGWGGGPFIATINMMEGLAAVALVRRWKVGGSALDSLSGLGRFILAVGVIPPLMTAPLGAALVTFNTGTSFIQNMINWAIGHGLGSLTFTPVLSMVARGNLRRWWRETNWADSGRSVALLALVAATACVVFAQTSFPILFLPALPLMLATFRLGRMGAAGGVVIVAIVGGLFTVHGLGPVTLIMGSALEHIQFFQFYLAVTLLTVLPVSADLTRRHTLYAALRDSEARFRVIMEHSNDIVLSLRRDASVRYISPSLTRQIRHDPRAFEDRGLAELLTPDDLRRLEHAHREALAAPGNAFNLEFAPPSERDADRWFEINLRAVSDADGTVGTIREITQRRLREAELTRVADTDPLTGLANRRVFDERVSRAMLSGAGGCVAIFDIDHFKRVNDGFGHAAGDEVLKVFAARAAGQLKAGDLIARLGGEEFGVVLAGATARQARAACLRICASIRGEPAAIEGRAIPITVSAGIASMSDVRDAEHLIRCADEALYRAKREGRNQVVAADDVIRPRRVA